MTGFNIGISAALGIGMGLFTYSLISFDYISKNYWVLAGSIKGFIIAGNIFLLIYIAIVESFIKEIYFRGFMFNELRSNLPIQWALILQALLYTSQVLMSAGIVLAVYAFLGSLLLGIIYYLGKSIWSSIIAGLCCTLSMAFVDRTIISKIFTNQNAGFLLGFSAIALAGLFWLMSGKIGKKLILKGKVQISS